MQNESQKLSIREKIGYSLGDAAANFIFQTVIMFLMFFYTDVFGISAAIVGTFFLFSRIWDAFNDPMMGAIADRTKTRWGKFRPWVIWTAIPFGVVGILTFTTPNLNTFHKIIYAAVTYNLLMMIYTANNIPYSALTGVLTGDSIERTGLASYRFILAMLAALVIQTLTIPLVDNLGLDNKSVIQSEVTGDLLTINPVNAGSTKVIVRTKDNHDNETKTNFFVKVTKPLAEIPVLKTPIEDLTLTQGFGRHTIDLTPVFEAGAYSPLSFEAEVEDKEVANVEVKNNQLTITEGSIGVTKVTVTARNKWKSTVNCRFVLAVLVPGNSLPVVQNKPEVTLKKGFGKYQINLLDIFSDPDGDVLVYTARNDNASMLDQKIEGSQLVLSEKRTGQVQVTVSANDQKGGLCSLTIPVIVRSGDNLAPALSQSLSSKVISTESEPIQIRLSEYFDDPDGDTLSYNVSVVNQAKGYQYTMGIFCILAVIFFFITFFSTKERVKPDPKQKTSLKQDLSDLFKNGPWVVIFFLTIFIFINLSLRGSIVLYYFQYYLKREDLFGWFNLVGMGITLIGIMFSKPLAVRFGKRNTFRLCLFVTAALTVLFVFLSPSAIMFLFVLQILMQFAYGVTIPMLWAMMADVADYSEWRTGRRATGMAFSAATFGLKMGLSLGGAVSGWLLSHFGYIAGADQTDRALFGIRLMISVIPAIPFFIGVAVLFFYKIDKKMELQMQDDLIERRKQYEEDTPDPEGAVV
ncbi:MAG: MFS transporter [Sedimentisphaerales bacterium]|nr:MFS transporter [Sedimentisphaerales bacterium]